MIGWNYFISGNNATAFGLRGGIVDQLHGCTVTFTGTGTKTMGQLDSIFPTLFGTDWNNFSHGITFHNIGFCL